MKKALGESVFRKKAMDRISSPEQLSDYLRVTTPEVWVIMLSVIILLGGIIAWSAVGTLETAVEARAVVQDGSADVILLQNEGCEIKTGMPVRVASQEYIISDLDTDEYGRTVAHAQVPLTDGTYEAMVITEKIHPISFLINGR